MTNSTDTTFFTNEEGNTLLDRFKVSLSNHTKYFDILVWYFRASGFFQLYKELWDVEKIRILVWLNVDRSIYDMLQQTNKQKATAEVKNNYSLMIQKEFEVAEDTPEFDEGVAKFIEFIEQGRLEIKVYPNAKIHAKVYIIRKDQEKQAEYYGSVITGSSNFSMSWLKGNLEFNVELKDKRDVDYALKRFEDLWAEGVEVTDEFIDTVKNKTHLSDSIIPYELYLKFLYEYFGSRVNEDRNELENTYRPEWFQELRYQRDAVKEAMQKLDKYNGVFLADVVWLGKTFISALLAQQLKGRILIICPPHLKSYREATFIDFNIPCTVQSLGKLDKILDDGVEKYHYVFIDEAHRFRNDETFGYESLKAICLWKKVILVSATPFNNRFWDLLSLIWLFQPLRNSSIPNIKNLEAFFKTLEKGIKDIDKKENYEEYSTEVKESSDKIRNRVLKHLMIRRTRNEIKNHFFDDIEQQWLFFPEMADPIKVMYQFDSKTNVLFEDTIKAIAGLTYARYTPVMYLAEKTIDKQTQIQEVWQRNLKGFMKTGLIKRLESSFFAFKKTLGRMANSYEMFLEMYGKGNIYVSKKVDVYDLLSDNFDELMELVKNEEVIEYKKEDLDEKFKEDLQKDFDTLTRLLQEWENVDVDPKIDELIHRLSTDKNLKDKQVILFSESKETIFYLEEKLKKRLSLWDKIFAYSANTGAGSKEYIRKNFDPRHSTSNDTIKMLLTTDVLAEWINLHKANVIINYDIPRNPTRILQRVGRINRIWTEHKNLFVYNFFPTEQSNNEIKLEENVKSKMEAFIKLLWTDAKHLTEMEDIETHSLFDMINSSAYLNNEDDVDWYSELSYLKVIRDIRDNDKPLFEKIRELPKKSRSARQYDLYKESLITFFRKGDYLKMYRSNIKSSIELDFEETIKMLECKKNQVRSIIDREIYFKLLENNKSWFIDSLSEDDSISIPVKKWRSNESEVSKYLIMILGAGGLVDQEEEYFRQILKSIEDWLLPKKTLKKVKNKMKEAIPFDNPTKIYQSLKNIIRNEFLYLSNQKELMGDESIEVILNEYLS